MKRIEAAHRYEVLSSMASPITDTANWSKFWPGYVSLEESSLGSAR